MTRVVDPWVQTLQQTRPYRPIGRVDQVVGLLVEVQGLPARLGDVCEVETGDPYAPVLPMEVVGFRGERLQLMPLGEMHRLSPGARVRNTGDSLSVAVGPELLGRVLDGLGRPIDDRYPLSQERRFHLHAHAPHPLARQEIAQPMPLGVRALDAFTTVGVGQRVGIFAGSGVGKSTTLGMIARHTAADLSVIALIGERGREVRDFIDQALGEEGLKRSILVVATSDQPALLKIKAALVATSIAEYFRKIGKNVILMMDSLTRVAMALREVGLAVGEPPASRGYPPSVYAFMPRLLERTGTSDTGSITGLYTVLVEGDDFNEPIADLVRGLLDGHVVLTRQLAEQYHFPAIDVLASVSRLMTQVASPEHRAMAGRLRALLSAHRQSEDLIQIGAYVTGTNPTLDEAIRRLPDIQGFLRQDLDDPAPWDETLARLLKLTG